MNKVGYSSATIYFPEFFREKVLPEHSFCESVINGKTISLKLNAFYIEARIDSSFVLPELKKDEIEREKILNPIVDKIKYDFNSIKRELLNLRILSNQGIIDNKFYYHRDFREDNNFEVYDYSEGNLFDKLKPLLELEEIERKFINPDYHKFVDMVSNVFYSNELGAPAYVKGDTLKEATNRALKIYSSKNDLLDLI